MNTSTQTAVLSVSHFAKTFFNHEQQKLLPSSANVNLEVHTGQLTALIGPTGAGKSSVLKGIYRTYLPFEGEMNYRKADGEVVDLAKVSEHEMLLLRQHEISFVTQFLHVLPRQSALKIVSEPLIFLGYDEIEAHDRARETMSQLNLPERLWMLSPSTFSGGERQRVNLARGLLAQPRLLLLDEPTASLDPKTTAQVVGLLKQTKQQNIAMLAIFHDMSLVEALADNVVSLTPPTMPQGEK